MPDLGEQIRTYIDSAAKPLPLDEVLREPRVQPHARPRALRRRAAFSAIAAALTVAIIVFVAVAVTRSGPGSQQDAEVVASGDQGGPTVGEWQAISQVPAELRDRFIGLGDFPRAVGVGTDVYVFAGHSTGNELGLGIVRYTPAADSWSVLPRAPIPQRSNVIALWTGSELIFWGGTDSIGAERDGAAYDPATNQWRRIADAPFEANNSAASVWTGSEMIIWGGAETPDQPRVGYAYNPSSDTWRRLADAPIPDRPFPTAVWTGSEMVIWGGCAPQPGPCDSYAGNEHTDGAAYNPDTDSWRELAPSPLPPRPQPRSVWTGEEMIIWGSEVGPAPADQMGAAYDPAADSWRLLAPAPIPALRDFTMVWDGSRALIAGGQTAAVTSRGEAPFGAAYDPDTDSWAVLPPPPYAAHGWTLSAYAWTNAGLFALSGTTPGWIGALLVETGR